MWRLELIFILILSFSLASQGQDQLKSNKPTFTPFNGTVYSIPDSKLTHGYKSAVKSYDVIKRIKWDKIKVSDRNVKEGFPDIDRRTAFGIVFKSKMNIPRDGYYKFSISSDDGSRIWIDNKLVVHNDFDHPMTKEESIVQLVEGEHDIKIWYYQAFIDRFGVEFDAKFVKSLPPKIQLPRVITIQDEVLFDYDKYNLSQEANYILDSLSNIIKDYENVVINIDGHTDNNGTDQYNIKLSNNRSSSVMDALMQIHGNTKIKYIAKGHSFHQPIATNDTKAGQQLNRRVVIKITKDGSGEAYFKEKEDFE